MEENKAIKKRHEDRIKMCAIIMEENRQLKTKVSCLEQRIKNAEGQHVAASKQLKLIAQDSDEMTPKVTKTNQKLLQEINKLSAHAKMQDDHVFALTARINGLMVECQSQRKQNLEFQEVVRAKIDHIAHLDVQISRLTWQDDRSQQVICSLEKQLKSQETCIWEKIQAKLEADAAIKQLKQ